MSTETKTEKLTPENIANAIDPIIKTSFDEAVAAVVRSRPSGLSHPWFADQIERLLAQQRAKLLKPMGCGHPAAELHGGERAGEGAQVSMWCGGCAREAKAVEAARAEALRIAKTILGTSERCTVPVSGLMGSESGAFPIAPLCNNLRPCLNHDFSASTKAVAGWSEKPEVAGEKPEGPEGISENGCTHDPPGQCEWCREPCHSCEGRGLADGTTKPCRWCRGTCIEPPPAKPWGIEADIAYQTASQTLTKARDEARRDADSMRRVIGRAVAVCEEEEDLTASGGYPKIWAEARQQLLSILNGPVPSHQIFQGSAVTFPQQGKPDPDYPDAIAGEASDPVRSEVHGLLDTLCPTDPAQVPAFERVRDRVLGLVQKELALARAGGREQALDPLVGLPCSACAASNCVACGKGRCDCSFSPCPHDRCSCSHEQAQVCRQCGLHQPGTARKCSCGAPLKPPQFDRGET